MSCWLELLLVHSGLSPWPASLLVRSGLALHWPFTGSRGFEARHLVLARGLRSREDSGIRSREVRNSFFGPLLELRPADRLAFGTSCTRCTPAARVCSANASSCSLARGTIADVPRNFVQRTVWLRRGLLESIQKKSRSSERPLAFKVVELSLSVESGYGPLGLCPLARTCGSSPPRVCACGKTKKKLGLKSPKKVRKIGKTR